MDFNHTEPDTKIAPNELAPTAVVGGQMTDVSPETPGGRRKRPFVVAAVIAGVILIAGGLYANGGTRTPNVAPTKPVGKVQPITKTSELFAKNISQVDCVQVKNVAKNANILLKSKSKYQCFSKRFEVSGKQFQSVAISLTPEFAKQTKDSCTLDCGYSLSDYAPEEINVGNYIVEPDGKVDDYAGFSGGGLDSLLTELTGCGTNRNFGIHDKLEDGSLVIDNNKLASLSTFSDLHVTDSYGNACTINLKIISYLTSGSEGWELIKSVSIQKLTVSHTIKDITICANETAPSLRQACYTTQAALRADASVCEKLASPIPAGGSNNGFDNCVIAVAKRQQNPQICDKIRYYRSQFLSDCQAAVGEYKSVLRSKVVTD